MIHFKCPACGKGIRVSDAGAGKDGKCPACGAPVRVPQSPPATAARGPPPLKRDQRTAIVPDDASPTDTPQTSGVSDPNAMPSYSAPPMTGRKSVWPPQQRIELSPPFGYRWSDKTMICPNANCGYSGEPISKPKGNKLAIIVLLLPALPIGCSLGQAAYENTEHARTANRISQELSEQAELFRNYDFAGSSIGELDQIIDSTRRRIAWMEQHVAEMENRRVPFSWLLAIPPFLWLLAMPPGLLYGLFFSGYRTYCPKCRTEVNLA